jgi:uncharacterized protein (DUF1330 family)
VADPTVTIHLPHDSDLIEQPLPGMPGAPPAYEQFTWPTDERQVTAERLAQCLTASAMHSRHRHRDAIARVGKDDPDGTAIYLNHTDAWVAKFGLVYLLRTYMTTNPEAAEEIAKKVWSACEDGETIHELMWDWAVGYGIPLDEKTGEVLLEATNAA